jgi:hypothetical protein
MAEFVVESCLLNLEIVINGGDALRSHIIVFVTLSGSLLSSGTHQRCKAIS